MHDYCPPDEELDPNERFLGLSERRKVGEGVYGKVYRVVKKDTGEVLAMKCVDFKDE